MAASSASTPVSTSAFSRLLRNTKFARFDPTLEQVYTSPPSHRHRGDYGLKRPLSARAPKYVRVRALDMQPHAITNVRSAGKEAHFIKRWEESGWTLPGATETIRVGEDGHVWRNISWFDVGSEGILRKEMGIGEGEGEVEIRVQEQDGEGEELHEKTERFLTDAELAAETIRANSVDESALLTPTETPTKGKRVLPADPIAAAQEDYHTMAPTDFESFLTELRSLRVQFARTIVREQHELDFKQKNAAVLDKARQEWFEVSSSDAGAAQKAAVAALGPVNEAGFTEVQQRKLEAIDEGKHDQGLYDLFALTPLPSPTSTSTSTSASASASASASSPASPSEKTEAPEGIAPAFHITSKKREEYARRFANSVLASRAKSGSPRSRTVIKPSRHGNYGLSYVHEDVIYNNTMASHVPGRVIRGRDTVDNKQQAAMGSVLGVATPIKAGNLQNAQYNGIQEVPVHFAPSNANTIDTRTGEYLFAPVGIELQKSTLDLDDMVKVGNFTADDARAAHDRDSMRNEPKLLNRIPLRFEGLIGHARDHETLTRRMFETYDRRIGGQDWVGTEGIFKSSNAGKLNEHGSGRHEYGINQMSMVSELSKRKEDRPPPFHNV